MTFAYSPQESENSKRATGLMFVLAAFGHLLFFLILILIPSQLLPAKRYAPSVINVSMVSSLPADIPPSSSGPVAVESKDPMTKPVPTEMTVKEQVPSEVKAPETKRQPEQTAIQSETAPVTVSAIKEEHPSPATISVSPIKKKVKTSLKKKTFRSPQVIKRAIKRIEKKNLTERPKTVTDAIERLKKEVAQAKPTEATEAPIQKSGGGFGEGGRSPGIPGRSGVLSRKVLEQIDLYKLEIAYRIEKKWAFSEQLTGGRTDLEAILVIKIMSSGEIQDIWFEKKSGNSYFDDSAFKAIKKSNPLPPLPKGYVRPFYNVGLVFTPSGLNRGTG
jgi:colicin import membrane protein